MIDLSEEADPLAFHLTQDPITSDTVTPCVSTGNSRSGQAVIGVVYENHGQDSRCKELGNIGETMSAKYGTGGNNTPIVVEPKAYTIGRDYKTVSEEIAGTLTNSDAQGTVIEPYIIGNGQVHGLGLHEKAQTLSCVHDPQIVIEPQDEPEYPYRARRLTPLECGRLQGYPDGWCGGLSENEPSEEEVSAWMEIFETHRRAVDPEMKPKTKNQVRKWLKQPHTDSAEYRMWGNSLAIPCAYTVLAGIAEALNEKDREDERHGQSGLGN